MVLELSCRQVVAYTEAGLGTVVADIGVEAGIGAEARIGTEVGIAVAVCIAAGTDPDIPEGCTEEEAGTGVEELQVKS